MEYDPALGRHRNPAPAEDEGETGNRIRTGQSTHLPEIARAAKDECVGPLQSQEERTRGMELEPPGRPPQIDRSDGRASHGREAETDSSRLPP